MKYMKRLDQCHSSSIQSFELLFSNGSQLPDTTMTVSDMEICEGGYLENKDLQNLVDFALLEVIKDLRKQKEMNSVKAYAVTGKYLPKDIKMLKEQSVIIDRARDGKSGQGADMCQEEYLKKGLFKVATGKINSFSGFRQVLTKFIP